MISIIIPINNKVRVEQANRLYHKLKTEAGIEVEVLIACDNPEIYHLLDHDVLVKIPRRIEFTQSVNIAEKFAKHEVVWYMDDSVTPVKNWGKTAFEAFYKRFPGGMGIMEISGASFCATRCLTTRSFAYSLNGNTLLWSEYLHCGDTEFYDKTIKTNQFFAYPEVLLKETKINDVSRLRNTKVFAFDAMIRTIRKTLGYPMAFQPNWKEMLWEYCEKDDDLRELYKNILNKRYL